MRRLTAVLVLGLFISGSAQARGILIPKEKDVPPLAMLNHHVTIDIEDQVAVTRVEQTFRNHTDRQLEATYVFPVPKGASVRKFSPGASSGAKVVAATFVGSALCAISSSSQPSASREPARRNTKNRSPRTVISSRATATASRKL